MSVIPCLLYAMYACNSLGRGCRRINAGAIAVSNSITTVRNANLTDQNGLLDNIHMYVSHLPFFNFVISKETFTMQHSAHA